MKKCTRCDKEKDETEFFKHKRDGLQCWCKDCKKEYQRSDKVKEYMVRYNKKYQQTDRGKELQLNRVKKYQKLNPEKRKAQNDLNHAIRAGKLERLLCEICGTSNNVHGHHDDYDKPFDVRWLCRKHHVEHHKKTRSRDERILQL